MSTKRSETNYALQVGEQSDPMFRNIEDLATMLECHTNGADAQLVRSLYKQNQELIAQRQYLLHQLKELCAEHNCVNPDLRRYYPNALAHLKLT